MSPRIRPLAWALAGKEPGERADYRLLSGRLPDGWPAEGGARALADQVFAAIPSNPQLTALQGPGALPWVTVIPGRDDEGRWLAVTVTDGTPELDVAGRPSLSIRQVRLAFADVAAARAGYQELYAAVPPAAELRQEPGLDLTPGPRARHPARALAEDRVFDRAARLAALLLDSGVMITVSQRDCPPLAARLAEFDQVMALLPAGMRAGAAIASWHDGTAPDSGELEDAPPAHYRLACGPFPVGGQPGARYEERPPAPAGEAARAYLGELQDAYARPGIKELLAHLARHQAPIDCAEAEQALEILRLLRDPRRVVVAIPAGRATVEQALSARAVASRQGGVLSDQDQDVIDEYLLAQDDPGGWRPVLDGWSRRTTPVAARAVVRQMAATGVLGPGVWEAYAKAIEVSDEDAFLAGIAADRTSGDVAVPAEHIAQLLIALVEHGPRRGGLHAGDLPGLRAALRRQPEIARWLLRLEPNGASRRRWWLDWLVPAPHEPAPDWLAPYRALAGPAAGQPDPEQIAAAPQDLALLAAIAVGAAASPAAQAAGPWWPVLLRLARPGPGGDMAEAPVVRHDVSALLAVADEPAIGGPAAARLDTLWLYLDHDARHLPLGSAAESIRYLNDILELWSRPPVEADCPVLAARLLTSVARQLDPAAATEDRVLDSVVAILRRLTDDDRVPLTAEVGTAIAQVLAAAPKLVSAPRLDAAWWALVQRTSPGTRVPWARLAAAVRDPAATTEDIAVLIGHAAAAGLTAPQLAAQAGPWLEQRTRAEQTAIFLIAEGALRLRLQAEQHPGDRADVIAELAARLLGPPASEPAPEASLMARFRRGKPPAR